MGLSYPIHSQLGVWIVILHASIIINGGMQWSEHSQREIFSERQHAERAICYRPSVRLSVRPSVCPSHGWISRKRLKLGSCDFHHTVAPSL